MGSAGNNLLGIVQTNGATAGTVQVINTSYPLSGVAGAGTFLFTEDTDTQTINKISPTGALISSLTGNFPAGRCCGESLFFDGTVLWRVNYAGEVDKLDPTTANVITSYPQSGKVGITSVNGTLWLSDWDTGDIGTWNPATNTFTPVFNTDNSPAGLAFDAGANILWIGNGASESVVPYSLTGTQLGAGFVPFGDAGDEIDGLTVFAATTPPPPTTPAPPSMLLVLLGLGTLVILFALGARRLRA